MKPGTLVRSSPVHHSQLNGIMYLTPLNDPESGDWPEWHPGEVGIVLPPVPGQIGMLVMVPGGVGLCFHDEIREIV